MNHILTLQLRGGVYGESMPASTELFRLPLVSFLYGEAGDKSFSLWGGFPGLEKEVAEISRVMRPGGRFVATTYLLDGPYSFIPFLRPIGQTVSQVSGSRIFLSEKELEDLFSACGFVDKNSLGTDVS